MPLSVRSYKEAAKRYAAWYCYDIWIRESVLRSLCNKRMRAVDVRLNVRRAAYTHTRTHTHKYIPPRYVVFYMYQTVLALWGSYILHTLPYSASVSHTLPYFSHTPILRVGFPYSPILHTLPYSASVSHTLPYFSHTPILRVGFPYSPIRHKCTVRQTCSLVIKW